MGLPSSYLPGHLAERVNAVGRLVDGEPMLRALDQFFVDELLFLDDRGFKFADPGNVERLGLVENRCFLAEVPVGMIGPFEDVLVSRNQREEERIAAVWNDGSPPSETSPWPSCSRTCVREPRRTVIASAMAVAARVCTVTPTTIGGPDPLDAGQPAHRFGTFMASSIEVNNYDDCTSPFRIVLRHSSSSGW